MAVVLAKHSTERSINAKLNARRQQALGISHYIWRSQDDTRVRSTHAARDDQIFSWDEQLPGGFPGEDFNCRCYAEPVLDDGGCNPKTGIALDALIESAALVGSFEAAKDFGVELIAGVVDLAALIIDAVDFGVSELAVRLGLASNETEAEVMRIREQIAFELENYDQRLEQIKTAIAGFPDLAAAFVDYADAVARRAVEMRAAYLACEASEDDLREAIREEAYLRTSVAIAVIPAAGLIGSIAARSRRLLQALGKRADGLSDEAALRKIVEQIIVPSLPRGFRRAGANDVDWNARTAHERGLSYERSLAKRPDDDGRGTWLEPEYRNHPGVDFFNFDSGQATSVKTLDLGAVAYQNSSSRIYGTLSRYLRELVEFDGDGLIRPGQVKSRTLYLAVPGGGTPEQLRQIRRAVNLAEDLGINMIVEVTE